MSQAKLTHTLGDNINEKLLIRDHLGCFIKKLCRHMAQGSNGVPRLRDRELKNDRHAVCKGGRDKLRGEHGKMSVDFASEAPRCQRISSITPQITFDQRVISGIFRVLWGKIYSPPLADPSATPVISKFGRETTAD